MIMYARRDIIGLGSKEQLAGLILDEFPQFFAANNARVNLILQTLNCIDLACEISHSADPDPAEWEHTAIFDKPPGGKYKCASKSNLSLTTLTVFYRPAPSDLLRHPDLVEKPGCKITIESDDESAQQAIEIITKALMLFLAHLDLVVCKEKTWQEHHPDYFGASVS
jgi:hypothetical protein